MPSLDTPDSNIFWYALTQNNGEPSKKSSEYFDRVKEGKGALLESVEEEIDSFIHKRMPYIQNFLIINQKIEGKSVEKALGDLKSEKGLDEKEKIVLENSNIVKYIYAKVGPDTDFTIGIQDIVRKDMNGLFGLFQNRIASLDKYSDKVQNEIEELNDLGLKNKSERP